MTHYPSQVYLSTSSCTHPHVLSLFLPVSHSFSLSSSLLSRWLSRSPSPFVPPFSLLLLTFIFSNFSFLSSLCLFLSFLLSPISFSLLSLSFTLTFSLLVSLSSLPPYLITPPSCLFFSFFLLLLLSISLLSFWLSVSHFSLSLLLSCLCHSSSSLFSTLPSF